MSKPQTITTKVLVQNQLGLHARPVTLIVKLAKQFASRISFERAGTASDAKSVMALLLLAAGKGTELTITAEGQDAAEAIEALEQLFSDKFGEE
jgi:phosphocarrier protein